MPLRSEPASKGIDFFTQGLDRGWVLHEVR